MASLARKVIEFFDQTESGQTSLVKRIFKARVHLVVIGKDSRIHIAQCHHARSRQGRGIDQVGTAKLSGVVKPIRQDQPSAVENLLIEMIRGMKDLDL